jgi:hypothetical protein
MCDASANMVCWSAAALAAYKLHQLVNLTVQYLTRQLLDAALGPDLSACCQSSMGLYIVKLLV